MVSLFGRLHVSFGLRRWEVQGYRDGVLVNYSGAPYLTKKEACAAARLWRCYDIFDEVVARNVASGVVAYWDA